MGVRNELRSRRRAGEARSDRAKDTVALVTGASRGIGAAIAERLAATASTSSSIMLPTKPRRAKSSTQIRPHGGKADALRFDVSNPAQVDEKFDWIAKTFGPLAVLVNNAGITIDGLLMRMKDEDLDRRSTSISRARSTALALRANR